MQVVPIQLSVTANLFIDCMLVGAALLAAWIMVRFERMGPRSLAGATVGWALSGALILALPAVIPAVVLSGLPEPRLVVLFGLALPTFTYFFLAGAWFMRTLMKLVNGLR